MVMNVSTNALFGNKKKKEEEKAKEAMQDNIYAGMNAMKDVRS